MRGNSRPSNLLSIFDTSDSSSDEASRKKAKENINLKLLEIPDTYVNDALKNNNKKPDYPIRTIIRDTIETREFLLNKKPNEYNEKIIEIEESLDEDEEAEELEKIESEKCINPIFNHNNKQISRNSQSTPMSVKKKLQEHGLLDMTNSPRNQENQRSPPKVNNVNNTKRVQSPKKKFNFSPIAESPSKLQQPTILTALANSPLRLYVRTPTKSPSSLTKNTPSKLVEGSENVDVEKSLDSSFEFREQLMRKSKGKLSLASKQQTTKGSKKLVRNLSDLSNDIPSPKKSQNQNRAKRFKQITMTQAFATQNEQNKTSNLNNPARTNDQINKNVFRLGAENNLANLEETCLPHNETFDPDRTNLLPTKTEPFTQVGQENSFLK